MINWWLTDDQLMINRLSTYYQLVINWFSVDVNNQLIIRWKSVDNQWKISGNGKSWEKMAMGNLPIYDFPANHVWLLDGMLFSTWESQFEHVCKMICPILMPKVPGSTSVGCCGPPGSKSLTKDLFIIIQLRMYLPKIPWIIDGLHTWMCIPLSI